jgi:hypothetical protein
MWLCALVLGLVGGFNPNLGLLKTNLKGYFLGWGIRAVLFFLLGLAYAYFALPALTGPFWGLGGVLLGCWILNCAGTVLVNTVRLLGANFLAQAAKVPLPSVLPAGALVIPIYLLLAFLWWVSGWEMFRAADYRALAGDVTMDTWSNQHQPVDIHHIRMVSLEQAEWLGNKVLGEAPGALGSRYRPGRYSIQRVQGELYWVAPLEFHDFSTWMSYGQTEGFVMVSAEDAQRKPRLVLGRSLRYLPSAYFGTNLHRHVYTNGYATTGLGDFIFELDEDLKPHWVVPLTHPAIGYSAYVLDGVLLIDPEDGSLQRFTSEDLPAWVDRVVPEAVAEKIVSWWGQYPHGWWNSVWGKRDVMVTTLESNRKESMWMVWGDDDQPYWFTGMTSAAASDQALTGVALVNSRNGHTRFHALSGANEEAVIQAVNAAVSNYTGHHATQPILYTLYGEPAWVVPVVSQEHIFQRLAIVRASNSAVVLGADKATALREFQKAVSASPRPGTPGSGPKVVTITLTLDRVAADVQNGSTVYYLYSGEHPDKVFTGTSAIAAELVLARPGDKATLTFLPTDERIVPLSKFELTTLGAR